jgi:hypothetical protein
VLADPDVARQRAERGRKLVLANHTFDDRAGQLVDFLTGDRFRRGPARR